MSTLKRSFSCAVMIFLAIIATGCVKEGAFNEGKDNFVAGDYHQAFDHLMPAAKRGNAEAQYAVGYMYFYGLGTVQNRDSAFHWMNKAAEQGQPQARQAISVLNNTNYRSMDGFSMQHPGAIRAGSRNATRSTARGTTYSRGRYRPSSSRSRTRTAAKPAYNPAPPPNQTTTATWPLPKQSAGAESGNKIITPGSSAVPEPVAEPPVGDLSENAVAAPVAKTEVAKPEPEKLAKQEIVKQEPVKVAEVKTIAEPTQVLAEAKMVKQPAQILAEAKIAKQPVKKLAANAFTVQLMGAYEVAQLNNFAANNNLQGTHIYRTKNKGRDWYVLGYGDYTSIRAAREAIQALPDQIRSEHPWVRNVSAMDSVA